MGVLRRPEHDPGTVGEVPSVACSSCGAELRSTAKFCDECAAPVRRPPSSAAPQRAARSSDPRNYTPRYLAERILASKAAVEGERKQVTVMFADLKGSMELAEQVDPEEWHDILDRYFTILTGAVHRFEGTVNQYTGDGIMALFGAPIAHEDHAQRACYASLLVREELARFTDDLRHRRGLTVSARIGLHSGDVVVGKIGDDLRMDYTAQGHTVGLAQRMESLAAPDTVYLTGATAHLVSGFFALEDLGERSVKGVRDPVAVFRLAGAGRHDSRFAVARERGLTCFVGRQADLRTLEAGLEQADTGNGQAIGIVAEPGTGKSRLCYEFAELCRRRGLAVLEGRAVAHGRRVPLLPVLQVYRAFYGIEKEDGAAVVRDKIVGAMGNLDGQFHEDLPLLFDFFGASDPAVATPALDPQTRQRRLFAMLRYASRIRGRTGVTVTVLEDLQWLDGASEAFIAHMVESTAGTRSLLILNFRPEYRADWMREPHYRQISLGPLGEESIRSLFDDLLGDHPSVKDLVTTIHQRSAGNPFFAEEIVQSLIAGGKLEGRRGGYRLVIPSAELEIPGTVQSVLAARIDQLPESEKEILQAAAVIGRDFDDVLLAQVVNVPAPQLTDTLASLKEREFVHERSLYPRAEYSFKHRFTQEVALGSQLRARRRATHAAVARALEATRPERLDETAALIAHHWTEAERADEAARWHERAAGWVARRDPYEAVKHWNSIRRLLAEDAAPRSLLDRRREACLRLAMVAWRLGWPADECRALFREGEELAERTSDPRTLALVTSADALWTGLSGDLQAGYQRHRHAHALSGRLGPAEKSFILVGLESACFVTGRLAESIPLLHEIHAMACEDETLGMDTFGFSIFCWVSFCLIERERWLSGHLGGVWQESDRVLDLIRARRQTDPLCWALANRAYLARDFGCEDSRRLGEVLAQSAEALEIAERLAGPPARWYGHLGLSTAYALRGQWAEAIENAQAALALTREHGMNGYREEDVLACLAEASRGAGDVHRALAIAREAVALSETRGRSPWTARAHLEAARAWLACAGEEAVSEAERHLEHGLSVVAETGVRVFQPQLVEEQARVAERRGDHASGVSALHRALDLYGEIGASDHAARVARVIQACS